MRSLFPQTLEAALSTEKSYWKLGDALLAECEESNYGKRGLQAVSDELAQYGIEYERRLLGKIRATAAAFPKNRRNHQVAFFTYEAAGNPDALDAVVRVAKKSGERVTAPYVHSAMSEMREQGRIERQKAQAEAKREQEKAREESAVASKKLREAKDRKAQDNARREIQRATQRKEEADEKLKRTKVAPQKAFVAPPADDDIPVLVLATSLKSNADKALDLAERNKKLLGRNVVELSPRAIAALTETALEAANAWRDFADAVRGASKNKRGHLSVVNE